MSKHAYLLMTHTQFQQVVKLLMLLDDERNDIYLHIDKKVKNAQKVYNNILQPSVKKSNLFYIDQNMVQWGGYSQIKTELDLLKAAVPRGYDYYHLLSGADLPLKTQDEIHCFFDTHSGREFVQIGKKSYAANNIQRYKYYWLFQEQLGNNDHLKFFHKLRYGVVKVQSALGFDRRTKCIFEDYSSGAQWFSITHDFAKWVIEKEPEIWKAFHDTICCDEIFLQTVLINSPFKDNLYSSLESDYHAIMRKIDWTRGKPYVWKMDDYDELINSDYLFARKFSENTDSDIISAIYNRIHTDKN